MRGFKQFANFKRKPYKIAGFRRLSSPSKPNKMRAVQVKSQGPKKTLSWGLSTTSTPVPSVDEVLVRNTFAGLNFIDTYHRSGLYPRDTPFILGVEGVGRVVEGNRKGQRVSYFGFPSYTEFSAVPADRLIEVPDAVSDQDALACMCQGMTAHYLTRSCFEVQEGHSCLVHAAGGATGQLIVALAKARGAFVIGTASNPEKMQLASDQGADLVLNYKDLSETELEEEVRAQTGGQGVNVVFDGVGKSTWELSVNCTRPRGTLVFFGNASGPVPPIDPLLLSAKGSLVMTRPTLANFIATREELKWRCEDLFELILKGSLKVNHDREFPLDDFAQAHNFIEQGKTKGKVVLRILTV